MSDPFLAEVAGDVTEFFSPADPEVLSRAALALLEAKAQKDTEDARAKRAAEAVQEAENALLAAMDQACVMSVKVKGPTGKPVTLAAATTTFYNINQEIIHDQDFRSWLEVAGGDLLKETINAQSFRGFCGELVAGAEEGKNPLHQLVKVTTMRRVSVTGR